MKDYKYQSLKFKLPINWETKTKIQPPSEIDGMEQMEIMGRNGQIITVLKIPKNFIRFDSGGNPLPLIDRGMIVKAEEKPIQVAGINTSLIKTEVFFGSPVEVLVVYLKIDDFTFCIFCKNINEKNFINILDTFKIETKSKHID